MVEPGPVWLLRGEEEAELIWNVQHDAQGKPRYRFDYATRAHGGEKASGTIRMIPRRWEHLLTPDISGVPVSL
ncbi:MAG TPA: hypothetical protein VEH27_10490 [Methylomirabilota bacterium]|nr:hypothetical protein [Methylomirabilota bacterium]